MNLEMHLREVVAADQASVIDLIDGVYREYGDRVHLEDADADLLGLPELYHRLGGAFVVLTCNGRLVGCHAAHPLADKQGVCTFRRLYLDASQRGRGHGVRLMNWALDWARANRFRRVEFWSDTRFRRAHEFFRRCGFTTAEETRDMNDGWIAYQEYFFWMELTDLRKSGTEARA